MFFVYQCVRTLCNAHFLVRTYNAYVHLIIISVNLLLCVNEKVFTVYALIFAGLNFRGLPIFAVFAFLFSRFVT